MTLKLGTSFIKRQDLGNERQYTELEKIFVTLNITPKGLVWRIWKRLLQISKEKTGILIDNGQKTRISTSQKRLSNSPINVWKVLNFIKIREAQMKVKMLYPYTSIRMGTIRDTNNTKFWEGCIELSYAAYGHVKSIST